MSKVSTQNIQLKFNLSRGAGREICKYLRDHHDVEMRGNTYYYGAEAVLEFAKLLDEGVFNKWRTDEVLGPDFRPVNKT